MSLSYGLLFHSVEKFYPIQIPALIFLFPKTVGRMLDEKYCIEGACPIVLDCRVVDGRHVFVAKNDGTNLAKAPMDMLPEVMDNDLRAVDGKIREYWGMAPLAASDKE